MKSLAGGAIENATLALKFIVNNPDITVAIPGMESVEQVIENARIGHNQSQLNESELINIDDFRKQVGTDFCRRCGYCAPCAVGIDIPLMFILSGYVNRYHLNDWATDRYNGVVVKADACVKCGACEPRCPYDLKIIDKMQEVAATFAE